LHRRLGQSAGIDRMVSLVVQADVVVRVRRGFTAFPDEIFVAPRSWVENGYPTLTYFNKVDRGGHFAAWEEPELFTEEVRAAFGPLR